MAEGQEASLPVAVDTAIQVDRPSPIYAKVDLGREFRQGEILSKVVQYVYDVETGEVSEIIHDYAIIASQDCDLLQDFNGISQGKDSLLNGVLLYEAHLAEVIKKTIGGSDLWKRVRQNKDERYHVLQKVPPEVDATGMQVPDLVVDFRRMFSMSSTDLMKQLSKGAARRSRLEMPYREQFQTRAAFYLLRVGVPVPHEIGN